MKTYSQYLSQFFPEVKVQKISVNTGNNCPNRDGTIGYGGCSYCRNDSFSPAYCLNGDAITKQIEEGKKFFSRKYPEMKYLVYFQSYTSTHSHSLSALESLYKEALSSSEVVGLVIGTRPDTFSEKVASLLHKISEMAPIFVEIGAETSSDKTLSAINRHHTWHDVIMAAEMACRHGLHPGLHLIAGLPGENRQQILENVRNACLLPIETLKIHQLQILYDTPLYYQWKHREIEVMPFEFEEYISLCAEILEIIPDHIVIERFLAQSPPDMVAAPKWGVKNYQFMDMLAKTNTAMHTFFK